MRLARLTGGPRSAPRAAPPPVPRQYVGGRPKKGPRAGTAARRFLTATRLLPPSAEGMIKNIRGVGYVIR